jgi:hypothetical protein
MNNNDFSTVVEILLQVFSEKFLLELHNLRSKISPFVHICTYVWYDAVNVLLIFVSLILDYVG